MTDAELRMVKHVEDQMQLEVVACPVCKGKGYYDARMLERDEEYMRLGCLECEGTGEKVRRKLPAEMRRMLEELKWLAA